MMRCTAASPSRQHEALVHKSKPHLLLFEGEEVVHVAVKGHVGAIALGHGGAWLRARHSRLGLCTPARGCAHGSTVIASRTGPGEFRHAHSCRRSACKQEAVEHPVRTRDLQ